MDIEERAYQAAMKSGGGYVAALRAEIEAHDATKAENERLRGLLSEALGDLCEWRRREYDPNDEWPLIDAINAALAGGTNDG